MNKLIIKRNSEWNNRLRNFGVYINGEKVGVIGNGETKEFDVEVGNHEILTKIDWCRSRIIEIEIKENENKTIELSGFKYGNIILPITLGILALYFIGEKLFEINLNVLLGIAFIGIFYPFFFITFGKNRYLRISEKK
jgi:hypothetical protein